MLDTTTQGRAHHFCASAPEFRACELLSTATTMYREMDMRFWLNEAEAEMNALE